MKVINLYFELSNGFKAFILISLIMVLRSNIVFLLLLNFTGGFAQSADTAKMQLQIDSLLETIYKNDAPGISISILQKGNVIFKNSYGLADLETKTNLNSTTNFNIGSLTKQFTAQNFSVVIPANPGLVLKIRAADYFLGYVFFLGAFI